MVDGSALGQQRGIDRFASVHDLKCHSAARRERSHPKGVSLPGCPIPSSYSARHRHEGTSSGAAAVIIPAQAAAPRTCLPNAGPGPIAKHLRSFQWLIDVSGSFPPSTRTHRQKSSRRVPVQPPARGNQNLLPRQNQTEQAMVFRLQREMAPLCERVPARVRYYRDKVTLSSLSEKASSQRSARVSPIPRMPPEQICTPAFLRNLMVCSRSS